MRIQILFVFLATCVLAQPSPPGDRTKANQEANEKRQGTDNRPQSPPAIANPSSVNGPSARNQTPTQSKESGSGLGKAFAPETWSNWALFVAAVVAGSVALRTLGCLHLLQRDTWTLSGTALHSFSHLAEE